MIGPATIPEAARAYIRLGYRPIPLYGVFGSGCGCGSPKCKERDWGKHEPFATDGLWKDGYEFGPDDFQPWHNLALAMGPQPNRTDWLVALDADGPFDWSLLGPLPPTLTQRSPRGEHRIFTVPAYTPLGNYTDCFSTKSTGYSLDLRYARGRIVVAPSRGATGSYSWVVSVDPAPLPDHTLQAILSHRRQRGLPVQDIWSRDGKQP